MGCGASARRYAPPLISRQAPEGGGAKGSSASPGTSEDGSPSSAPRGRWLWEESPGVWQAYDPLVNDKLNAAREVGEHRLAFAHKGSVYEVNFHACIQTHWDTGNECKVRYKGPPAPNPTRCAPFEPPSAQEDSRGSKETRPKAQGEWQFEGPPDVWTAVEGDAAGLLRLARQLGKSRIIYEAHGNIYGADLDTMVQVNLHTGFKRRLRWMPSKQFQWQLKNGVWVDYDEEENDLLAAAVADGKGSVRYAARGFEYQVNLEDMQQENTSSHFATLRKVRVLGADVLAATIEGRRKRFVVEEESSPSKEKPRSRSPPAEAWADGRHGERHGEPRQPAARSNSSPPEADGRHGERHGEPRQPAARSNSSPPEAEVRRGRSAARSPSPAGAEAWSDDGRPRVSKRSPQPHMDDAFRAFVNPGAEEVGRDSKRPHREGPSAPAGAGAGAGVPPREKRWSFGSKAEAARPGGSSAAQGQQQRRSGEPGPGLPPRPSPRPAPSPRPTRDDPQPGGPRDVPPREVPPRGRAPGPRPEPEAKRLRLPRGVDWPDEPAARAAAKALFTELASLRDSGASAAERRKAYRQTCLRWHPDKNPEDEDTATDVFQFLQDIKDWCIGVES